VIDTETLELLEWESTKLTVNICLENPTLLTYNVDHMKQVVLQMFNFRTVSLHLLSMYRMEKNLRVQS